MIPGSDQGPPGDCLLALWHILFHRRIVSIASLGHPGQSEAAVRPPTGDWVITPAVIMVPDCLLVIAWRVDWASDVAITPADNPKQTEDNTYDR